MQLDRQIRVNELLLQREELFLRIHAAESEITRLLRGPYPFERPALPSDRRGKRKPAPAAAPVVARKTAAEALRRLADGEAGYRVTYLQFNREVVETHPEFAPMATLLAAQAAHLSVLRVETLAADGAPREVLFDRTRDADAPRA